MANRGPIAKRRKRFDALLAMPLKRFRRQLTELSLEELTALEQRIAVQTMRHRWALGAHGMERHRAHGELGLLERRRAATRMERQIRGVNPGDSLRSVDHESNVVVLPALVPIERAA